MLKKTFTYGRLVFGTLLAIVFAYIIYQVANTLQEHVQTVHVSLETAGLEIGGTALLVRDEVVLPDISQPYYSLTRSDGEKVAAGDHYARVFSSSAESSAYDESLHIQSIYDRLVAIHTNIDESYELSDINQDILLSLSSLPASGHLTGNAKLLSDQLGAMFAKRHYALSDESNLEDALDYYAMRLSTAPGKSYGVLLNTSVGGYYSSTADGFEAVLNLDNASSISCKDVEKYISDPAAHTNAFAHCPGRIVTDYRWKFLLPVSAQELEPLKLDKRYQVSIMGDRITATLTSISPVIEGMAVLEFTSNADIGKFSAYRTADVTVVIEEYTGYRIPIDAMRMIDGKTGVFCLQGYVARYVEVDVLWKTDRYYIVDADLTSDDGLFTNDYVIVNTKGIYDGKVVTNNPLSNN